MPLEPITGQRRYSNGGALSLGDLKLLGLAFLFLVVVHVAHDYLGLRLPSRPVLEFVGDISQTLFGAGVGLYWARTRKP